MQHVKRGSAPAGAGTGDGTGWWGSLPSAEEKADEEDEGGEAEDGVQGGEHIVAQEVDSLRCGQKAGLAEGFMQGGKAGGAILEAEGGQGGAHEHAHGFIIHGHNCSSVLTPRR